MNTIYAAALTMIALVFLAKLHIKTEASDEKEVPLFASGRDAFLAGSNKSPFAPGTTRRAQWEQEYRAAYTERQADESW